MLFKYCLLFIVILLFACSEHTEIKVKNNSSEYGELHDQIGDNQEHTDFIALPANFNGNLSGKTGYGSQTGKGFIGDKGGHIGFAISSGEVTPKSEVDITLDSFPENRKVQFQLSDYLGCNFTLPISDDKVLVGEWLINDEIKQN
ncbi:hypothetical protein [Priestia abyssalis]|uniref:hypothetical protein n=1 Tax=Priestia abyssalis TaxID=1221450 RepID=UPI000994F285|nr:hypothetical protein [Priestia abyssalis]